MDNEMEMEFALPSTIDEEAIECSIQLAEEMGILFEKGGRVSYITCICYLYVTEYWKTDHVRTFGQLLFIGPANSHTHTLPVHCCINGLS